MTAEPCRLDEQTLVPPAYARRRFFTIHFSFFTLHCSSSQTGRERLSRNR